MKTTVKASERVATDLAREAIYRFLGAALRGPRCSSWELIRDPDNQRLVCASAEFMRTAASAFPLQLGHGEAPPDMLNLDPLCAGLMRPIERVRDDYDRAFGLVVDRGCPPYETEFHTNAEAFFRAQQMADVAGFYRAFGIAPSREAPERADYLPLELEFMAFVIMKQRLGDTSPEANPLIADHIQVCNEVQRAFFREHLAWWVPAFAAGLRQKDTDGLYGEVGRILAAWIPIERWYLNIPRPRVALECAVPDQPEEQLECAGCSG